MKYNMLIVGSDHHNTLGVIESFAETEVRPSVIVLTSSSWAYVLKSKYVRNGWICHTEDEILHIMLSHFSNMNEKTVVYSTCDRVSSVLDKHYDVLKEHFVLPNTKEGGSLTAKMSKEYMSSLARKIGLSVPKTWIVKDGMLPDGIEYPCITKAISSIEGSKDNICICSNEHELSLFLERKAHCPTIQIQKYIDKKFEFQLLGCSMGYGNEILIPGRTHIDRPNGMDNTFFLRFDKYEAEFESLVLKVRAFIKSTGYQGPFSVEFLRDKNGVDYFTEMNFRNDGNAYCVTASGTNLPYIYYLYNIGGDYQCEIRKSYVKTTYLTPEFYYFKFFLSGEFGLKEWLRNMKRTTCYTTYFRNDKRPFVWFFRQIFIHTINAICRKIKK